MTRSISAIAAPAYDPYLYAAVHSGSQGDLSYYRRACQGAERVLELGCGYGRLIATLCRDTQLYVGIERDRRLLKLAQGRIRRLRSGRRHQAYLLEGDMTRLPLQGRFDRIVLPYSGLYCLADAAQVRACFAGVSALLADDGAFILDAYNPDSFHAECAPEDQADDHEDWVAEVTVAGDVLDVFESSCWDRKRQRLLTTYRHVSRAGKPDRLGQIAHRYLLSDQLVAELERAGLKVTARYGDFDQRDWESEGDHTLIHARRAHQRGRSRAD